MSEIRVDNITDEAGTGAPNFPSGAQGVLPTGVLMYFAMDTAPTGFLKANGAAVSRTTFSDLFSAIGTTFGAGDGSTTFELPDLRGEFPRGWDDGRGVDSGRSFGSFQVEDIQSHRHSTTLPRNNCAGGTGGSDGWGVNGGASGTNTLLSNFEGGVETRPRNIALLACIKF